MFGSFFFFLCRAIFFSLTLFLFPFIPLSVSFVQSLVFGFPFFVNSNSINSALTSVQVWSHLSLSLSLSLSDPPFELNCSHSLSHCGLFFWFPLFLSYFLTPLSSNLFLSAFRFSAFCLSTSTPLTWNNNNNNNTSSNTDLNVWQYY